MQITTGRIQLIAQHWSLEILDLPMDTAQNGMAYIAMAHILQLVLYGNAF